jgi:hypothetical protein
MSIPPDRERLLSERCPWCSAEPGKKCHVRGGTEETARPHLISPAPPTVHGCAITVTSPDIGRTDVVAELKAYGAATPEPATIDGIAIAAEQAAKGALRYAKLMSLAVVEPDEWFALGDKIKRFSSGTVGEITGIRKAAALIHAAAPGVTGVLRSSTFCGTTATPESMVTYQDRSEATCRACGGQGATDGYEPRLTIRWASGASEELLEDDLLFGLRGGVYVLP